MPNYQHQISEEEALKKKFRILVAGSRYYNDYEKFSNAVDLVINNLHPEYGVNQKIRFCELVFISGMAKTGADDLIIRFCEEHKIPWTGKPANWNPDPNNPAYVDKGAGYKRNAEMGNMATRGIIFWDLVSRGTKNMIDILSRKDINTTIHVIPFKLKNANNEEL